MNTTHPKNNALLRATYAIVENDLPAMLLGREQLPLELRSFQELREEKLDNARMAAHGFGSHTPESLAGLGRIGGRVREFVRPRGAGAPLETDELLAATVAHLFNTEEQVSRWIEEVFVREFLDYVGKPIGHDQELVHAERLDVSGLHDRAAGIFAIQKTTEATLASTVIDFRVGRLLGVAYVVALSALPKQEIAEDLARSLEQQMVRIVLDA